MTAIWLAKMMKTMKAEVYVRQMNWDGLAGGEVVLNSSEPTSMGDVGPAIEVTIRDLLGHHMEAFKPGQTFTVTIEPTGEDDA
jgi:hypothetical protein